MSLINIAGVNLFGLSDEDIDGLETVGLRSFFGKEGRRGRCFVGRIVSTGAATQKVVRPIFNKEQGVYLKRLISKYGQQEQGISLLQVEELP